MRDKRELCRGLQVQAGTPVRAPRASLTSHSSRRTRSSAKGARALGRVCGVVMSGARCHHCRAPALPPPDAPPTPQTRRRWQSTSWSGFCGGGGRRPELLSFLPFLPLPFLSFYPPPFSSKFPSPSFLIGCFLALPCTCFLVPSLPSLSLSLSLFPLPSLSLLQRPSLSGAPVRRVGVWRSVGQRSVKTKEEPPACQWCRCLCVCP